LETDRSCLDARGLGITDAWWPVVTEATNYIIRIPRRKWDGSINHLKPVIRVITETVRLMLLGNL